MPCTTLHGSFGRTNRNWLPPTCSMPACKGMPHSNYGTNKCGRRWHRHTSWRRHQLSSYHSHLFCPVVQTATAPAHRYSTCAKTT